MKMLTLFFTVFILFSCRKEVERQEPRTIEPCKFFCDVDLQDYLTYSGNTFASLLSSWPVDSFYGKDYKGGVIFFVDSLTTRGGICSKNDYSNIQWGCFQTSISGADDSSIGKGLQNTMDIDLSCLTMGIAADTCLNTTINGFDDWFLPSKNELNEIYRNVYSKGFVNYSNNIFWTSTESDADQAWVHDFLTNAQENRDKNGIYGVIPIRQF